MILNSKKTQMHSINNRPTLINIIVLLFRILIAGGRRNITVEQTVGYLPGDFHGADANWPEPELRHVPLPLQHKSRLHPPASPAVPVKPMFPAEYLCERVDRQTRHRTVSLSSPASSAC